MSPTHAADTVTARTGLDALAGLDTAGVALQAEANSPQRIRYGRVAAGVASLAAALGLSAFFVVFTATSEAVVTGRVVTLPTPIAGTVLTLTAETGDPLEPGQIVGRVRNDRADGARLDGLRTQQAGLTARLAAIRAEMTHKTTERERLIREVEVQRLQLVEDFSHQYREAALRLASARAQLSQHRREHTAATALFAEGLVPRLDLERLHTEVETAEQSGDEHRSAMERIGLRLAALRRGSFSAPDAPPEKLRVHDLALSLVELQLSAQELAQSLATIDDALRAEQLLLARMSEATIESPVRGRVWKRVADSGQFVNAGSDVLELVESSSVRVEAYFHQRYLPSISVGDAVVVMPLGGRDRLDGRVQWIGAEASASTRTVAPQWQPDQDKPMRVVVALADADRSRVFVGQRARVIVSPSGTSPVAGGLLSLLSVW